MKAHRPTTRLLAALACSLVLASTLSPSLAHAAGDSRGKPHTALGPVPGEVIVKFKAEAATLRKFSLGAGADNAALQSLLSSRASTLGARVGRTLEAGSAVGERTQVMRASGVDAATLARQLAADPEVEYAVPNGRMRLLAAPNDPFYNSGPAVNLASQTGGPASGQWYLHAPDNTIKSAINIESAWAHSTGTGVVVAVLDTGVRFEHPDLGRAANGGNLLPGYDFVTKSTVANDGGGRDADPSDPGDWTTAAENNDASGLFYECGQLDPTTGKYLATSSSWHGTATSSLIGALANNDTGMAGVAPGVKVLPVRVLGKCFGENSDILPAMRWAAGIHVDGVPDNPNPARVINMSLGSSGECTKEYQDAVNEIVAKGVTIVAAAGNSAGAPVGTPGNCNGVIAVLALRHAGTKVGFSDLGPEIGISAPGGNCVNIDAGEPCLYPILAATNTGTQGPVNSGWSDAFNYTLGTSFSSPLVAGVAGLMMAVQPALTPAQLRNALHSTARAFPSSGADNGPDDPTPVTQCQAPSSGVEQYQCYCNTQYCGAGMLDAGAAVAAVVGPVAHIDISTTTPTAGSAVTLSGAASTAASGTTLSYAWTLVDGGGIVTAFSSATNAASATLTPSAAGSFTARLTVTDSMGLSNATTLAVTVAAAPTTPTTPTTPDTADSGGGGAASVWWVLGLLTATLALLQARRHERRRSAR